MKQTRLVKKGLFNSFGLCIILMFIFSLAVPTALAQSIGAAPLAPEAGNTIRISQIYGGGGNTGATYKQDYVELFNAGFAPVSLAGMTIQYASATGTGNFGSTVTQITELPSVTVQPGQYYLVREGVGTGGTVDVPADFIDPTPIAMSATNGKIALVNKATTLGCNGGSTPCSPEQLALIVDLIGFGNANFFEGSAAVPVLSNTTAAFRKSAGCLDTDVNSTDFVVAAPSPRNASSPYGACGIASLDLVSSTDKSTWVTEDGSLADGFDKTLDPLVAFYYLNVDNVVTNKNLAEKYHPFYVDTYPVGFFDFWNDKGVNASADPSSWQYVMWQIINGDLPMFYLLVGSDGVGGQTFQLVDGMVYQLGGADEYLRVNGNYLAGDYTFAGLLEDTSGNKSDLHVAISFATMPAISDLDLVASLDQATWDDVYGNLADGWRKPLDPATTYYYLDVANVVTTRDLEVGYHPFYLDTSALPTGFYEYWAGRGIDGTGSEAWQVLLWDIINGDSPIFYLKVSAGPAYMLVDGFTKDSGGGDAFLKVDGTYHLGAYTYNGIISDQVGGTVEMSVQITFEEIPEITVLDLVASTDQANWAAVTGGLVGGWEMTLDPTIPYYYLNVADLVANKDLEVGYHPFTLDTSALPAGFYEYWAGRGIDGTGADWQLLLWDIINGNSPIFYLKVSEGPTYMLVDGFTKDTGGGDAYLRVDGTYLAGTYLYDGVISDGIGGTSEMSVQITFNTLPLALTDANLQQSLDQATWTDVPGTFAGGFTMSLNTVEDWYYLDIDTLVVNRPLADGLYPFFVNTTPAGFLAYWATRGVDGTPPYAEPWQPFMWEIVNGNQPLFYLKVTGTDYMLVDGLTYQTGGGEAYLRINGSYLPGIYTFLGTVEDEFGFEDDVPVQITFNDIPIADTQNLTTDEDTGLSVTLTATDLFPGALSWIIVSSPQHGDLSGTAPDLTYTPAENYNGSDSFTFKVNDGTDDSNTATVSITIDPVNDAPVADNQSVTTPEETPLAITLTASDVESVSLTYEVVSNPVHGKLTGTLPNLTYTPDPVWYGMDSFTFKAYDGALYSEIAMISIVVTNILNPPSITSTDLPGPYMVGLTQEFHVTLTNPSFGDTFTNVLARFRLEDILLSDINSIEYLETALEPDEWLSLPVAQDGSDVIGDFGPATGFPMSAPYNVTSSFRINFKTPGAYDASIILYDLTPDPDTALAAYIGKATVLDDFEVTEVDLVELLSPFLPAFKDVPGNLADGYTMLLNGLVEFQYLDAASLTASRTVADGLYPFYITSHPDGFFEYWAARGVVAGAGSWQGVMWEIINGNQPMFYVKVVGSDFTLLDGLSKLAFDTEVPLRINGDYWPGTYGFSGELEDLYGFTDDVPVTITFVKMSYVFLPVVVW